MATNRELFQQRTEYRLYLKSKPELTAAEKEAINCYLRGKYKVDPAWEEPPFIEDLTEAAMAAGFSKELSDIIAHDWRMCLIDLLIGERLKAQHGSIFCVGTAQG